MNTLEKLAGTLFYKDAARGDQLLKSIKALMTRASHGELSSAGGAVARLHTALPGLSYLSRKGDDLWEGAKNTQGFLQRHRPIEGTILGGNAITALTGKLTPGDARRQNFEPLRILREAEKTPTGYDKILAPTHPEIGSGSDLNDVLRALRKSDNAARSVGLHGPLPPSGHPTGAAVNYRELK